MKLHVRQMFPLVRSPLGQFAIGYDFGSFAIGIAVGKRAEHRNFQLCIGPIFVVAAFKLRPYDAA